VKNWTVVTERVKDKSSGLIAYGNYLVNGKHSNHSSTTIVPLKSVFEPSPNRFLTYAFGQANKVDQTNQEAKKGGRPVASYAQSFVLTLPPEYQPTDYQWAAIAHDVSKSLAAQLGINVDDIPKCMFGNIHQQKNSHLNIVVSKCYKGKVLPTLDQKATLNAVKTAFTSAVLEHVGIDTKNYKKLSETTSHRRKPRWQFFSEKIEEYKKAVDTWLATPVPEVALKIDSIVDEVNNANQSKHKLSAIAKMSEIRDKANEISTYRNGPKLR
jgi:hypothetical protein